MNYKVSYLLALVSMAGLFSGCAKERQRTMQEKLTGTWAWVRTDGGIANHIHRTPANTGKNVDLTLEANGTFTIYTNDTLTSEGTYTLESRKCIHDHENKTYVKFSTNINFMVHSVNDNRLEVSDEAYDGLGSVYERGRGK